MRNAGRPARRVGGRAWCAAGTMVAVLVVAGAGLATAGGRTLLVTKATWVDTAEQQGTMLFQGEIVDGTLSGRAYPGDGTELIVSGTVDATGDIAGTLNDAEQELVATFTGELNAAQELVGDLYVTGALDAAWAAPAEELPVE